MSKRAIAALKFAQSALWQYQSDLQFPPTGDSIGRRLGRVKEVLDEVESVIAEQDLPA